MHFAVLPPEVNSGRIYAGPGVGPMLTAASAWDELANELHSSADDFEAVVSGLTSDPWQGPASASMGASAAPQTEWLRTTAAQATQASTQAKAAASAYESAYSMTVPPSQVAANRAQLMTLQATNLLGQNASAIAATEVEYGEMWAQDVAAMYGYAGAAKSASQVTPFASPQQATNQGGLATQSAAVGQAAGTSAGNAQSAMSAVPNALQSLESSGGLTGFSDFSNVYDLAELGSGLLGNGTGLIGLSGAAGFITKAEDKIVGDPDAPGGGPALGAPKPPPAARAPSTPKGATAVSAEMGEAGSLGRLSVPQDWASSAPQVRLAALESPMASAAPASASGMFSDMPLLGQTPLMAMPGRDTSVGRGPQAANQRSAPARQDRAAAAGVIAASDGDRDDRASGAAAQMREITDVLGKLADLRDTGALTEQEFNEQKQRLLGGR
jgi:PPE-repeat protein